MLGCGESRLLIDSFFKLGDWDAGNIGLAFVLDVLVDHGNNREDNNGNNNVVEVVLDERYIAKKVAG